MQGPLIVHRAKFSDNRLIRIDGIFPSASGKTTSAHCLAKALVQQGTPAQVVSLDNFFKGAAYYPKMPDGTLDYENLETLDLPLIKQCLHQLSETGKTELPIYDFATEQRADAVEPIDLQGGVCIVEGIHALNPELTGLVPDDQIYRIYAGLREEYCIDGRRVINTQDIRLCRRTLRDAAARGRSPAKTLSMWDRVLDGETRYIKGFKTTADFLLDTSFTYELVRPPCGACCLQLHTVCEPPGSHHIYNLPEETAGLPISIFYTSHHILPDKPSPQDVRHTR